jgi:hypothetical protein
MEKNKTKMSANQASLLLAGWPNKDTKPPGLEEKKLKKGRKKKKMSEGVTHPWTQGHCSLFPDHEESGIGKAGAGRYRR